MSTAYSYHFDDDIFGLSRSWTGFPARSVQVPSQREVPSLKFLFRLFRKSISKNQLLLGLGHAVKGPTGFKAFRCLEITTAAFKIFPICAFEPFVAKKSKETAPPPHPSGMYWLWCPQCWFKLLHSSLLCGSNTAASVNHLQLWRPPSWGRMPMSYLLSTQ